MEPLFTPALHRQRHQFVIDFVVANKPKQVVDLGCAECTLLKKLKFHRDIELLVGVDLNGAKLQKKMNRLAPISTDYLQPSFQQLHIDLYQGSVTQKDPRLKGFDLVTSIELIEHLTLADLESFCEVVFGYMAPLAAIITTPNSEFNPHLPGLTGFRHTDHKFEWTRAEFQSWALKVCSEFGYKVEFSGVGKAPPGLQEAVGFCSQIAVFHRLGGKDDGSVLSDDAEDVFSYIRVYSVNYPSLRNQNILRKVLVGEVLYWAEKLKSGWMEKQSRGVLPLRLTEDGKESPSEQRITGNQQTEKKEEFNPGELDVRGVCEDEEDEELLALPSSTADRYVSVPLDVLWSSCPKVSQLSGSLSNLRHLIMDDPQVKLSQDGSAVIVYNLQPEREEEEEEEDVGHAEASCCSSRAVEVEEDWEANV